MSVLRLASVLVLSTVLSVFAASATAVAQTTPSTAPPGNSAVDQYRESLPPSSSETRKLSRRDRAALDRRGPDGAALAAVLDRSDGVPRAAPSSQPDDAAVEEASGQRRRSDPKTSRLTKGTSTDAAPEAADSRPIAPAAASSTVGPIPVWVMLVAAVALVGVGLVVRVRSTS